MSNVFSSVWLLPLLEKPYEAVALNLPDAIRALRIERALPTEIALRQLLVTALESHSEYWVGLALQWLEQGFPQDPKLTELLMHCSESRTLPQSDCHKARRLASRTKN
ncbi:hypothetical protein KTQ74_19845 [Pseudomonas chlororaphis]|uniref:hypothetical protein n=1 Tax=Pseudomonas chlororaphis TaxID=587753 RepID=UPI001E4985F0|nr:hypothetical protein [Pseudomonas chlororaphis]MCB2254171.1 hypothetical protein [Pseudomonas chlororaphis]